MSKRPPRVPHTGALVERIRLAASITGPDQYVKVLHANALWRVVDAVADLRDDVVLTLEAEPCWRRKSEAQIEGAWRPIDLDMPQDTFILVVSEGFRATTAVFDSDKGWWVNYIGQQLTFTPTHWAPIPELPKRPR